MQEVIQRDSPEFRDLMVQVRTTITLIERITATPPLCGERYYTGAQISQRFHISPRALQVYRDTGAIPFTTIGGKILYPETELIKLLESNTVRTRR